MPFIRFLARFNRYIYIADFSGGTEGWLVGRSTGAGGGTQAAACGGIKKLRHLPYALAGAGGEDEARTKEYMERERLHPEEAQAAPEALKSCRHRGRSR